MTTSTRRLVLRLLLGCGGALGTHFAHATGSAQPSDAVLELAQRVVHATGPIPSLGIIPGMGTVAAALAALFDGTGAAQLAGLSTTELRQLLAQRIQQDYQKGALVLHQGWWLARSEAAILQLRYLLAVWR